MLDPGNHGDASNETDHRLRGAGAAVGSPRKCCSAYRAVADGCSAGFATALAFSSQHSISGRVSVPVDVHTRRAYVHRRTHRAGRPAPTTRRLAQQFVFHGTGGLRRRDADSRSRVLARVGSARLWSSAPIDTAVQENVSADAGRGPLRRATHRSRRGGDLGRCGCTGPGDSHQMWCGCRRAIASGWQHCDLRRFWGFRRAVRVQGVDELDCHGRHLLEAVVVRMVRRRSEFHEGGGKK